MQTTFHFWEKGKPSATLDIELKETEKGAVFTVHGEIKKLCWGQCVEKIADLYPRPEVLEILDLWGKYHLNDMHADCAHAVNEKKAEKILTLRKFKLKPSCSALQDSIKKQVNAEILETGAAHLTEKQRQIYALAYTVDWVDSLPADIADFYTVAETKQERAGFVKQDQHPDGVLCKPCPVCGYKYGTAWNFRPIPDKDLNRIKEIITENNKKAK